MKRSLLVPAGVLLAVVLAAPETSARGYRGGLRT
jgi:hypothetical protein